MARQKGDGKGRMGGRAKGVPNKVTKERRDLIDTFLNEEWADFVQMYRDAEPAVKLKIYMELIPYTTPKMATVEYNGQAPAKSYKDELDEISGEKTRQ